jgi:hypothetical protein
MACHLDGPVAVVTMNHRPYNLMGRGFTEQLIEALRWVGESGARAAILRSGLRHFSAGADLDDMLAAAAGGDGTLGWPILEMLQAFDELPIPIVAAVHGNCLGGGLEMALACDLIIAAESAKIGSVEGTVGLHPLAGGIQRLTQRAGAARAKEMAMLGRRYDAHPRTLECDQPGGRRRAARPSRGHPGPGARRRPHHRPCRDQSPGHYRDQRGRRRRRQGHDRTAKADLFIGGLSHRGGLAPGERPRHGQL